MTTRRELAKAFDHTLLKPEATPSDIDRLCDEALTHRFATVCVNGLNCLPCAVAPARSAHVSSVRSARDLSLCPVHIQLFISVLLVCRVVSPGRDRKILRDFRRLRREDLHSPRPGPLITRQIPSIPILYKASAMPASGTAGTFL